MDIAKKIRLALAHVNKSQREVSRSLGKTPQNFYLHMQKGDFRVDDLEKVAEAIGASFVCYFEFPDKHKY